MTQAQIRYKQSLIQKIQMNKRNVFLDDEQRREFMRSRFGCGSLKKMSITQLALMLDFCLKKVSDIPCKKEMITLPQKIKIEQTWQLVANHTDKESMFKFIKRITGKLILSLDILEKEEATKVIVALEKMREK